MKIKYQSPIISVLKSMLVNFIIILAFAGFFSNSLRLENSLYGLHGAILITLFYKFIRPLLMLISIIPIILTLGFFVIFINAGIILLVSNILSPYFEISSFWSAFGLAIFISVFNLFISNDKNIIIKKIN